MFPPGLSRQRPASARLPFPGCLSCDTFVSGEGGFLKVSSRLILFRIDGNRLSRFQLRRPRPGTCNTKTMGRSLAFTVQRPTGIVHAAEARLAASIFSYLFLWKWSARSAKTTLPLELPHDCTRYATPPIRGGYPHLFHRQARVEGKWSILRSHPPTIGLHSSF